MQATSTVLQLPAEFVCGKLQLQPSTCQVLASRDSNKSHHTGGCCSYAYQHAHLVSFQSEKRKIKKSNISVLFRERHSLQCGLLILFWQRGEHRRV